MNFDISRLRRSDQIIAGGAIALFIFLFFFKWYGGSVSSSIGGVSLGSSVNGWHAFTNSHWIWLITIIVALGVVALKAAGNEVSSPVQPGVLVAGLGALSTALILYRIIHHPSASASGGAGLAHFSYSYGIKIGIWLGLISAAAITYGGYQAMQAEGTSVADVRSQASSAFGGLASQARGTTASGTGAAAGAEPAAPPPPIPSPASSPPPIPSPASSPPPIPPPAAPPEPRPGGETPSSS